MIFKKLTPEQKDIYNKVMQTINNGVGDFFFLDEPGGSGKTVLIKLIFVTIQSQNGIALTLASFGIGAT